MDIRKISLQLKIGWFSSYVVAGCIALLYETGVLQAGTLTEPRTIYMIQVISVAAALALIPLSLKGFKNMLDWLAGRNMEEKKLVAIYLACAWLRLAAFFAVIVFGVFVNYLLDDDLGLYVAIIGAICSLFCYPSRATIENETGLN